MKKIDIQQSLDSSNGFPTKYWGREGWRLIHLAALNFPLEPVPRETREGYFNFFNSLCYILPCGICRQEFCKTIKDPTGPCRLRRELFWPKMTKRGSVLPRWQTRFDLFKWTVDLHNIVNARLKKNNPRDFTHWFMYYLQMRPSGKRHV